MITECTLEQFTVLFTNKNESYLLNGNKTIKQKITQKEVSDHFMGNKRIGTFPIVNSNRTNFFVFDIDNNDKNICSSIYNQLKNDGLTPYIENSKSKGFHVWVFLEEESSAKYVRDYMKYVLEKNSISKNKIDLFPKQDETNESNSYGNAINLPLFNLLKDNSKKNKFLDENFELIEGQIDFLINIKKSSLSHIPPFDLQEKIPEVEVEKEEDILHEIETLEKLLSVGKKTKSLRESVIKAKKSNRSERDTIYAKHLAELQFSKKLIGNEIKNISPKYNDPNLRGMHKENYLQDKMQQLSFLTNLFAKRYYLEIDSVKKTLFQSLDEDSEPLLFTKRVPSNKFSKIDDALLDWMEIEFHQISEGDYYAISTGCGGGKSNVIKQLCLSIWAYNAVNYIKSVKTLVAVERIEDGVMLEKISNVMKVLKLMYKFDEIQKCIDETTIEQLEKYTDGLFNKPLQKIIEEKTSFALENKKMRINVNDALESSKEMSFKCSPNEKVCLEGYSETDFQRNPCVKCDKIQCPAHPEKAKIVKAASVSISTHQALMKSSDWGSTRTDENGVLRQLLLIDEKPEALRSCSLFLEKSGNYYKTSIDSLLSYLKENGKVELYTEINDNFLKKMKELYSKAKKSHKSLNSGNQAYDIYKSYTVPSLSIKGKARLEKLKADLWSDSKNYSQRRSLSEVIETILLMNGKDDSIVTFGKRGNEYELRVESLINQWDKIVPKEDSTTIIFDATANIDPSYLVDGAPSIRDLFSSELRFNNLHIVFYSDRDISKEKVTKQNCDKLFNHLSKCHPTSKRLIVCSKDKECIAEKSINSLNDSESFYIDHFNNLKGKNRYIDCNVIAFTNLLRRTEANYLLMAQEVFNNQSKNKEISYKFKVSNSWKLKRGVDQLTNMSDSTFVFNDEFVDNVRTSVDVVDIIQTIFRISLRRDYQSENYVYLPISSSGLLKKIIHYFRGAKVSRINI